MCSVATLCRAEKEIVPIRASASWLTSSGDQSRLPIDRQAPSANPTRQLASRSMPQRMSGILGHPRRTSDRTATRSRNRSTSLYARSQLDPSRSAVCRTNSSTSIPSPLISSAPPVAIHLARIAELISGWNCTAKFRPRMKACDELALRASSVAPSGRSQRS
jgi:hypothetical protein